MKKNNLLAACTLLALSALGILFLLSVLLSACGQLGGDKATPLLAFNASTPIHQGERSYFNNQSDGWYLTRGMAQTDTTVRYKDAVSLHLSPTLNDSVMQAAIYYSVSSDEVEGDSICFSGKYKYTDATNATLSFTIRQMEDIYGQINYSPSVSTSCSGNSEWISFTVKGVINPKSHFFNFLIHLQGQAQVWVDNCEVHLDKQTLAEALPSEKEIAKDKEFDAGSGITLPPLTPQMTDNLEVLGRVWGFLKYYHPAVTQGRYNWDYELFRILPEVANVANKQKRSKLLGQWIDSFGKITTESQPYTITDSAVYSRIICLDWLTDETLFDRSVSEKLLTIKNARRSSKINYYVIPYMNDGNSSWERERAYPAIKWDDQGYRILTLFKLWNAVEYCFPYTDLTDKPWKSLLKVYISRFTEPKDKRSYELALLELGASIDDSHGNIQLFSQELGQIGLYYHSVEDFHRIPVKLIETQDRKIVVQETQTLELERGDIITHIDGEKVETMIERLSPYTATSNQATRIRDCLPVLLATYNSSLYIRYIRKGKECESELRYFMPNRKLAGSKDGQLKPWKEYLTHTPQFFYIHPGSMTEKTIVEIMKQNMNKKGLIIDMRKYPRDMSFFALTHLFTSRPETFMWFSMNEKQAPGNYKFSGTSDMVGDSLSYFKGKVAILVDENTQSHAEFCAMGYRMAPQSAVIGSTTAGADGNFGRFSLPGNIKVGYTHLGAYYPDWKLCQRKGVDIDIEVRPTAEDIRKGKDVWIEKAIEYLLE